MFRIGAAIALAALAACGGDKVEVAGPAVANAACPGLNLGPPPAQNLTPQVGAPLQALGNGVETSRYTAEVNVRGSTAYTTSWGTRSAIGNKVDIWDVSGTTPVLVDSLIVTGAATLGDVAVSDDGALLVVATERLGGSIVLYSLANPRKPAFITQYHTTNTDPGVHTAEIGRVNGKLYGFLSIDPINTTPARLVTVDLSNPQAPREVFTKVTGNPFVHDTFVRDGLLFLALWNDGVEIWDIGGCGTGASPEKPTVIGAVKTLGGEVHNIWWFKDSNGSRRFAFVGEEGPGSIGSSSVGDIHVIDLADISKPKEVAFFHVAGAGTHNFSVDEANGVLYAAYYNGGVQALDVRGDLSQCAPSQQSVDVPNNLSRCDLGIAGRRISTGLLNVGKPVYVWGVQYLNGRVYASDMLNGIWTLTAAK
jgi:hypothetical protein